MILPPGRDRLSYETDIRMGRRSRVKTIGIGASVTACAARTEMGAFGHNDVDSPRIDQLRPPTLAAGATLPSPHCVDQARNPCPGT